jgi:hypothetical protein
LKDILAHAARLGGDYTSPAPDPETLKELKSLGYM